MIRTDLDLDAARPILEAIASVGWTDLQHAYGRAADVENQLAALVVGDAATRESAWWNLWGNIHHQGTIYSATVSAVPILGRLSSWATFPDRVESILFLREVAASPGVVVWRIEADETFFDAEAQDALAKELAAHIDEIARARLRRWEAEPPEMRRGLLWLLSVLPHLHERYADLIQEERPSRFEAAWSLIARGAESEDDYDEIEEFERWILYGPS